MVSLKTPKLINGFSKLSLRQAKLALFFTLAGFLLGCQSPEEKFLNLARQEIEKGHFRIALAHLEKNLRRNPESEEAVMSAREAARVAYYEIKDYSRSIEYYRHLLVYSKDAEERLFAQKQLVAVYFEHLADYKSAVVELHKLINMPLELEERTKYKMDLARAYYYMNNFEQAEYEVDEYLRAYPDAAAAFDMLMLKGNINLALKKLDKAAEVYLEVIEKFPDKSKKENVALTLSVTYEEMKDYSKAIAILQKLREYHPVPEYIDLRVKRLEVRRKNQPGARGFRK